MKIKLTLIDCLLVSGLLFAQEGENEAEVAEGESGGKYELSAQVGFYYTQGYGNYLSDPESLIGERTTDFSNLFLYLGFEGLEFDHLRFGASALGSVKLAAGKTLSGNVYTDSMGADAILYQAYIGFVSDYFNISAGREELDMEWINDYTQGARLSFGIPSTNTSISGYYFDRQAIADPNEIVTFEDNKVGPSFVVALEDNTWEHLLFSLYFMSLDKRLSELEAAPFNAVGLGAVFSFGKELTSDTTIKYAYFDSKDMNYGNTNYLQIQETIAWSGLEFNIGIVKSFNSKNLDSMLINVLGDQNIFEQGDQLYANNAFTAYVGIGYNYDDLFNVALLYGNSSGIRNVADGSKENINELNLGAGFNWSGIEVSFIYSKVFGSAVESLIYGVTKNGDKKLNRDYLEMMVAYNF